MGSISGGILLKWVPYWHMLLTSLFLHSLGYVLYAVATTGWLIMISKLLSGVFIGAEMTLALAYFGESNAAYRTALKEQGKNENKATRVKHKLFALHSVGVNVGYIFGPGLLACHIKIRKSLLKNNDTFFHRCSSHICTTAHQPISIYCMVQCSSGGCIYCIATAHIQRRK